MGTSSAGESESGRDRAAVSKAQDRPVGTPQSSAHALIWGLRYLGDEAQLTQVVAEVARADPRFAAAFVEVLLRAAERDGHADNVHPLVRDGIPEEFECLDEVHLRDARDAAQGRIDLRFDGGNMTLFVENKLFSGYGNQQLKRYLEALKRLPPDRRAGLVAVTRDYPGYGEPSPQEHPRWLGSVRWARILDELLELKIQPPQLQQQWRLLLEVLDDDGDLGRTTMDTELVKAWARYRDGRAELIELLNEVSGRALVLAREAMKNKYPRGGPIETLARLHRGGAKGQIIAHPNQANIFLGFCLPAIVSHQGLYLNISAESGEPELSFEAEPWQGAELIAGGDARFTRSSEALQDGGYERRRGSWTRAYPADKFLDAADVPARILELFENELAVIIPSGIFDRDVKLTREGSKLAPPRHAAIPVWDDE